MIKPASFFHLRQSAGGKRDMRCGGLIGSAHNFVVRFSFFCVCDLGRRFSRGFDAGYNSGRSVGRAFRGLVGWPGRRRIPPHSSPPPLSSAPLVEKDGKANKGLYFISPGRRRSNTLYLSSISPSTYFPPFPLVLATLASLFWSRERIVRRFSVRTRLCVRTHAPSHRITPYLAI